MLIARDCNGALAPQGAALTWLDRDDQSTTTPYVVSDGCARAANLLVSKAGLTRVVIRAPETNQIVARTNLAIRPSAVTLLSLGPTPEINRSRR